MSEKFFHGLEDFLQGVCFPTRRNICSLPQGVGSHAAAMLLRSGVQRLRLIDFDQAGHCLIHCSSASFPLLPFRVLSCWGHLLLLYASDAVAARRVIRHQQGALYGKVSVQESDDMTWGVDSLLHPLLQVTLSSLNRHAVATRADVGLPKATVLAAHFRDIVPEAKVKNLCNMLQMVAQGCHRGQMPVFRC